MKAQYRYKKCMRITYSPALIAIIFSLSNEIGLVLKTITITVLKAGILQLLLADFSPLIKQ